jgi:cysteine sulfinate desulfinase/cysteine desulfurase-like protein
MGVEPDLQQGSLRLSLGPATTDDDVDAAVEAVVRAVAQLRTAGGAERSP